MVSAGSINVILFTAFSAFAAWAAISLILRTRLPLLFADTPDHRKAHSAPIPRVGGLAIIAVTLAAALVWHALPPRAGAAPAAGGLLAPIAAAAAILGTLGLLDDSKFVNIRVRHKLIVTAALAALTVFAFGAHPGHISMFGLFTLPGFVSKLLAVLWIMGLINGYNLIDGLDGFAGTISTLSLLGAAAVLYIIGDPQSACLGLFAAGAVAGFMAHNAPPAKVFMGDTGSCFIGYMLALLTIRAAFDLNGSGKATALAPLLAGIPILEVLTTILRRYVRAGRRGAAQTLRFIVTADSFHLHHRFLYRGFSHLDACVLTGALTTTMVCGAVCVALAPHPHLHWIAAYLTLPVAVCLYKLGLGESIRMLMNRPPMVTNFSEAEASKKIKQAGKTQRTSERRLFYSDLLIQVGLGVPVFACLGYLIATR
jgi:UDP-GlcNAc:undecaprenyl-phosphate GlcNAc-1-phosphate transferase